MVVAAVMVVNCNVLESHTIPSTQIMVNGNRNHGVFVFISLPRRPFCFVSAVSIIYLGDD